LHQSFLIWLHIVTGIAGYGNRHCTIGMCEVAMTPLATPVGKACLLQDCYNFS